MKITRREFSLSMLSLPFLRRMNVSGQRATVTRGQIALDAARLRAGEELNLVGEWLYKPGYLVRSGEQPPQALNALADYVPVTVPQMLNRIRWWLDDSEDFKRHEARRLSRLGFDTERAEDGWYRLRFRAGALPANHHLFVEFEGVAMRSRTFCNGHPLGEQTGMFSRFGYDLTPHLRRGRNTLDVYVSMERIPVSTFSLGQAVTVNLTASKILTLSKGMFGPLAPDADNRSYDLHGIWQPVKFVIRNSARIDDAWFVPSLDGADVRVEARSLSGAHAATLKARWIDKRTEEIFASTTPARITLNQDSVARHTLTLSGVQPRLWTPAEPNLYRLEVTLESARGEVLDQWTQSVGFRTFAIRGNRFYLNDQPYWLRGANQLPYGKNPTDPTLARKLIQLMHDGNQRVTRTHATPWNESWLTAADEIGLGVSVEGIRPWALAGRIGVTPPAMFEHWLMENEDVIKRGRNHPSVLMWTIGNEMLLRDGRNLEKWRLLSEVVKQTRRLDPTRPVIADSTYVREAEFYNEALRPNNIDDGDVDDVHRYRGWYSDSPFVIDSRFEEDRERRPSGERPFIGQEMSSGYPDLDTGLPVLRYTRDLLTPQAWIGQDAYPGSDPAVFLEHNRAVTKRWAEQLRFQRGTRTAGFMLFSNECWFAHSYDPRQASPYPVYNAVRYAWASVGLALETARRRFYAGEEIETAVFVTNDDENFRELRNLNVQAVFVDAGTNREIGTSDLGRIDRIAYYETVRHPIRLSVPEIAGARRSVHLIVRLTNGEGEISRTLDVTAIFARASRAAAPSSSVRAVTLSLTPELTRFVNEERIFAAVNTELPTERADPARTVILIGAGESISALAPQGRVRGMVNEGATAILFSPGESLLEIFPEDVLESRIVTGEYADFAPARGTKLSQNLQPMDIKWWARKSDWRVFVASSAHRLKPRGAARELIRFIPAHGYIPEARVPEQLMTVLFEIPVGRGRVWVCDLDLEESISIDPAARLFASNLLRAASDPASTRELPVVPSHRELLAGRRRND